MAQRNPRKPRKPLPKHQKKVRNKNVEVEPDQGIRLNRFISNAGICSRREADKLIQAGEISINGKKVKELGIDVIDIRTAEDEVDLLQLCALPLNLPTKAKYT